MGAPPGNRREVLLHRVGSGALLVVALLFVMMMVYLPHMDTLEGRVNPTGAVEGRSDEEPWSRFGAAYGSWVKGEREVYPYPMHMDSFVHWVRSEAVQREETVAFSNPYNPTGEGQVRGSLRGLVHEPGFWLSFSQFQELTGVPWEKVIQYAPMFFGALTASLVWASLRPAPWAPLAAAFVGFVPSSARFLGIGFFVPIGIGLAWIAASLLLSHTAFRRLPVTVFTLLLGSWAFFIHLIAGFAFVMVVAASSLPSWRTNRARTLFVVLGVALPFFAFYDRFQVDFGTEIERLGTLPIDFTVFDKLGIPFMVLWGLGTAILLTDPPRGRARVPAFAAALGSLLAIGFIVVNVAFRLQRYALYDRWHLVFAMLAVIPVAYALYMGWRAVRWIALRIHEALARDERTRVPAPGRKAAFVYASVGLILIAGAFAVSTSTALGYHLDEPYYRVLNDDDWEAFNVAKDLGPEYEVFLTHPWKAPAFNAMSGKIPHTWLAPGSPPVRGEDYDAYRSGRYADGAWLIERDITLIIDPQAPSDPAYETIAPNVHVLDRELARELHKARAGD